MLENRLLASLDAQEREPLAPFLAYVPMARDQRLSMPGDTVDYVYFPEQGMVSVVARLEDGRSAEVGMAGREGAWGVSSALAELPSAFEVVCQIEGGAQRMSAAAFRAAVAASPGLRRQLGRYLDARLSMTEQSIACIAVHPLPQRLARWLLTCSDFSGYPEVRMTHEYLGFMLAVSRTTVTQVAGDLEASGLITQKRGRIIIEDRAGLEELSCECHARVRQFWDDLWPGGYK